ncbi:hypothetical protein DSO57_1018770 [Entomophthora muscae]|uniref:Uncharacterized protein n=1 Tax=Entomophthora muscae TaxID=34485 RepID=A0ACC2TRB0_9FUNG|nr:hypothetical protein DSO57_1018770 [Entomophthora muscae]
MSIGDAQGLLDGISMPLSKSSFISVVNAAIHHVLILPSKVYFKDKYLSFAFALQNESGSNLGNSISQFPDSAQLTFPTHACGK